MSDSMLNSSENYKYDNPLTFDKSAYYTNESIFDESGRLKTYDERMEEQLKNLDKDNEIAKSLETGLKNIHIDSVPYKYPYSVNDHHSYYTQCPYMPNSGYSVQCGSMQQMQGKAFRHLQILRQQMLETQYYYYSNYYGSQTYSVYPQPRTESNFSNFFEKSSGIDTMPSMSAEVQSEVIDSNPLQSKLTDLKENLEQVLILVSSIITDVNSKGPKVNEDED